MNNFLLFIGAVLVVALAALFAVPHFVDWTSYRSAFEQHASRVVGREVRVGGKVNLSILPVPYLSFENVRVADRDGRFGEPPLRVEAFTLWLSIPPLLKGAIEASEVDLRKPEVLVTLEDEGASGQAQRIELHDALLPTSVALRAVSIKDGTLRVRNAARREVARFDAVNGELSASALDGPYRLRGEFVHRGTKRTLRLSTGKLEKDASVAIDAQVGSPDQTSITTINGRLVDVTRRPVLKADLVVKPGARTSDAANKSAALPFFEVRSKLEATTALVRLDDIVVSFETAGRPQTLTGSASAVLGETVAAKAQLAARWLDLDHIGGARTEGGPLAPVIQLAGGLVGAIPDATKGELAVSVEQATLGGDTVIGIAADVGKIGDDVVVNSLTAGLPGNGRISLSGTLRLAEGGKSGAFAGPVRLRAQSGKRFAAWALPDVDTSSLASDAAFSFAGNLVVDEKRRGVSDLVGEVAGSAFRGDVAYVQGPSPALEVEITSDRLDLKRFAKNAIRLQDVWEALLPTSAASGKTGDWFSRLRNGQDASVKIRVGHLVLPATELRDVSVHGRISDERIAVSSLRFDTPSDLKVEAEGRLNRIKGAVKGSINLLVTADKPDAVSEVVRFLDAPEAKVLEARKGQIVPLRMGGILKLGSRAGGGGELVLDGTVAGTQASIISRLEGDLPRWRENAADLTVSLTNASGGGLVALLMPESAPLAEAGGPARASIRANGIPARGLSSAIELETRGFEAGFSGILVLADGSLSGHGEAGLRTARATDSLRFFGVRPVPEVAATRLVAHSSVKLASDSLDLSGTSIRLGAIAASGAGRIVTKESGLRVDLDFKTHRASIPVMAQIFAAGASGDAGGNQDKAEATDTVWTNQPIRLGSLGRLAGSLKLEAEELVLGQGVTLARARLDAEVGPGRITLRELTGSAFGGRFSSKISMTGNGPIVGVEGSARLDDMPLSRYDGVAGTASLSIAYTGRGASAREIVSGLAGEGQFRTSGARIAKLAPESIEKALTAALAAELAGTEAKRGAALQPGSLIPVIQSEIAKTPFEFGAIETPLRVLDGVVRSESLEVQSQRGRARIRTFIDLNRLVLDSEWRLETDAVGEVPTVSGAQPRDTGRVREARAAKLPPVSIAYTGPLSDLQKLEPKIDADALERELILRRMEKELAELEQERLAAEAEAKARAEAEAQAREAARSGAQQPAPVPVPQPAPVNRPRSGAVLRLPDLPPVQQQR